MRSDENYFWGSAGREHKQSENKQVDNLAAKLKVSNRVDLPDWTQLHR